MNDLFNSISSEILQSKTKFIDLKNSTISEKAIRAKVFSVELEHLNKTIPEIVNGFFKSNELTDSQFDELKKFIDDMMTEFMFSSGISVINPNFRFNINIKRD